MTRRERKKKSKTILLKRSKFRQMSVEKNRYPVRRYEQCHNKFLDYEGIKDYLCKIQRNYPRKVQLQEIGRSSGGKAIVMAIISCGGSSSDNPKMSTMIEAGSNGDEWMAVSIALFMIDFLAKNENLIKLMDYFIIPCSNPDAYECSLCNKRPKSDVAMCLVNNFPILLGTCDMKCIDTDEFLLELKQWKCNYKCNSPETIALVKAIASYQFAVKMFISLQGNGTAITYPYGFCPTEPADISDLKKVARAGQQALKSRCFDIGTIYKVGGLTYGTVIDFLRTNRSSIQFTYIIQVNKKEGKLDPSKITKYGQEMMTCVKFMARNVYMFYNKSIKDECKSSLYLLILVGFGWVLRDENCFKMILSLNKQQQWSTMYKILSFNLHSSGSVVNIR